MMCGKVIFFSCLVGFLAVFLSLDFFIPYREAAAAKLPLKLKSYFDDFVNLCSSHLEFLKYLTFSPKLFSKTEVKRFTGVDGDSVYLALLGRVYDVTRGRKHYGPDGGYHGFAGQDGTRAFVTGDFTPDGLIEDVSDLQLEDYLGLQGWQQFYEKDYKYVGKLVGHFYDKDGNPTEAMNQYLIKLAEAKSEKKKDQDDARRFPPCNSEWRQDEGTRFWCSTLSGGVERDWVGVPRQYFQPGRTYPRCACVRTTGPPSGQDDLALHDNRGDLDNPKLKLYDGCEPTAESCHVP
ncbi:neuferricin-like [Gigantopelta aegis]|uniref:neuferricin-like n=1 Tax=Gigantopelta aegis TaxID=1735272 RepID=UPI001B888862|nr:neuferricin-like [Gigantopelta aegis]